MSHDPYEPIAYFYDQLIGDRYEVPLLKKLIRKKHPKAASILELACGTGQILQHFSNEYEVSGLDISKQMLQLAEMRIHPAKFYQASMSNFEIHRKFDVILCVFNSINHLLKFREWQSVFSCAVKHLHPKGLFLFDINTEYGIKKYPDEPPIVKNSPEHHMTIEYFKAKNKTLEMEVTIFQHQEGDIYRKHHTVIPERSFSRKRIEKELEKHFKEIVIIDPEKKRPSKTSEELLFVAQS